MPCIKVKVSQDLYQELGLCLFMELVRSDSKGSIKFVPLSDKSDFDYHESLRLTSPTNIEKVTGKSFPKVLSCEPISSNATLPSASTNEEGIAPVFKSSRQESDTSETVSILREDEVRCTTDKLSGDKDSSKNKSENMERPDINKYISTEEKSQSSVENDSNQGGIENELTPNKENKIVTPALQLNPVIRFPFANPTGNTILMTPALNPIVNFTPIANPSGFIVFPHTPVNTLPAGVHISESSAASERVTGNNDQLKIDTTRKVCKDAPRKCPSAEDGTKSRGISSADDFESISSEGEVSVDNDSNQGVFEKVLTVYKGNTTPGVQVNPFIGMASFANPSGYVLFPNKDDVFRIEPNPSGSLSSVILSHPQLAIEQQKTSPSIAKPLKVRGVESLFSPQNMQSTEVPVSDFPHQNSPVIKGYSAPNKSLLFSDAKRRLLPKPRNWVDRKPAVPTKTFPPKLASIAGGFTALTDSPSDVKISPIPKEKPNDPFTYWREEDGTRIKLQCKNCLSVYSTKSTFSTHIGRCDFLREKKAMGRIKYPRKCQKCSVLIFTQGNYSRHLKKCPGVYLHTKNQFNPVESDSLVQSTSLVNNVLSKEEDKYILYKNSESYLLYCKKKASKSDK